MGWCTAGGLTGGHSLSELRAAYGRTKLNETFLFECVYEADGPAYKPSLLIAIGNDRYQPVLPIAVKCTDS